MLKASLLDEGQLPLGEWVHLTVVFAVEPDKGASFEVTALLADGQELHGSFPYGDPAFERLTWLGFTAPGEVAGSCYLDNLELAEE